MGLFDIFKKKSAPALSWDDAIVALNNDKISLQDFINSQAEHPLFYSTPAGENANGEMQLWLLHNTKLQMDFYPTFLSKELCFQSFTEAGRKPFMIIEGSLKSALDSLDTASPLSDAGLSIQGDDGCLMIPPHMRVKR